MLLKYMFWSLHFLLHFFVADNIVYCTQLRSDRHARFAIGPIEILTMKRQLINMERIVACKLICANLCFIAPERLLKEDDGVA